MIENKYFDAIGILQECGAAAERVSGKNELRPETGIERHWREEAEKEAESASIITGYLTPMKVHSSYNQAIAAYAPCVHDPCGTRQGPCPECIALQGVIAKRVLTKAAKKRAGK